MQLVLFPGEDKAEHKNGSRTRAIAESRYAVLRVNAGHGEGVVNVVPLSFSRYRLCFDRVAYTRLFVVESAS